MSWSGECRHACMSCSGCVLSQRRFKANLNTGTHTKATHRREMRARASKCVRARARRAAESTANHHHEQGRSENKCWVLLFLSSGRQGGLSPAQAVQRGFRERERQRENKETEITTTNRAGRRRCGERESKRERGKESMLWVAWGIRAECRRRHHSSSCVLRVRETPLLLLRRPRPQRAHLSSLPHEK